MRTVKAIFSKHDVDVDITWTLNGQPFLTDSGELVKAAQHAIKTVTGQNTELSTAGGTSDGRFIAPTGAQVIELGPVNATIHKINECVSASDLETLTDMYEHILINLLT